MKYVGKFRLERVKHGKILGISCIYHVYRPAARNHARDNHVTVNLSISWLCYGYYSQGVKCIYLGEPGKWVQSFFLSVFMLYRYCSP